MDPWFRHTQSDVCVSVLRAFGSKRIIRAAFVTTDTDDRDMAAADSMGIISTKPSYPNNTGNPAAIGMHTAL